MSVSSTHVKESAVIGAPIELVWARVKALGTFSCGHRSQGVAV
jgi:hypothetical protein